MNHILSMTDLSSAHMRTLFGLAKQLKKETDAGMSRSVLAGKTLVMIFEKPSLRTRLSFEIAMTQLGGHAVYLSPSDIGMGKRETIADVARVVSSMGDVIMARVFSHATLGELAAHAGVPVINALSDWEHPCQSLADLFTLWERKKARMGQKIAFVGDGENNVTHSLAIAAATWGMNMAVASPKKYWMNPSVVAVAQKLHKKSAGCLVQTEDPVVAVQEADVVYTDTWVSMGDEKEKDTRLSVFAPYQVTPKLMSYAKPDAYFLHDLPAYRGNEVTSEVIDGPQSLVFEQAENRLHIQKALLLWVLKAYEK